MSLTYTIDGLGTCWWIELFEDIGIERGAVVKDDCAAFITTFEKNYSRFKADSLISKINTKRVLNDPSQEMVDLLNFGKAKYLETNTLFNILTGHIQEAKGYNAEYNFKAIQTLPVAGNPITDLIIENNRIKLSGESKIDIGGYGKGYLIDLLAERLKVKHNLHYFLINGGGDMYGTSDNKQPIEIHLEHPTKPGVSVGTTSLFNEAFAASSPHKRKWTSQYGDQNHIVGKASDSSYVKAKSAKEADVAATVALLKG